MRRILLSLALAAALTIAPSWAEDICDIRNAPRVVAIGDVHGAYDNFVKVLQMTGLVDEEARWIGGRAHFVQTGDLLDRGTRTREVLDPSKLLLWEGEAELLSNCVPKRELGNKR